MTAWSGLTGAPFVTVSPVGTAQGYTTNNGANFGPDTSGTSTSGIQEALLSIQSTGGTIYCVNGNYSNIGSPLYFTGPNQRLEFASGSSLTFSNNLPSQSPNWFDPGGHYKGTTPRLIHMGSPISSSSPTPYSHQAFIGNGLQINWGTNTGSILRSNGFGITLPGATSSPSYTGPGGADYLVEGVVCSGKIECQLIFQTDNYGTAISPATESRGVAVRRFAAAYVADENALNVSAIIIRGGAGVLVEDCSVDVSACTTNVDSINITGDSGETREVLVRRSLFTGPSSGNGSPVEVQGNDKSGTLTGGCHDILFEHCTMVNASNFIDDSDRTTGCEGYVYNVEFRQCTWISSTLELQGGSQSISVGVSPFTYANTTGHSVVASVSGGAVTQVKFNGVLLPSTTGPFAMLPGDSLTVVYSTAPTMSRVVFGYLRFSGNLPGAPFNYDSSPWTWLGRGPSQPGFGGSSAVPPIVKGTAWQNLFGFPVALTVRGGTSVTLSMNGVAAAVPAGPLYVSPGDTVTLTWTAAPSLYITPE